MNFRTGFYAGLIVAAIWAIYLVRLWQPERQIELHSIHLLQQIEKKNWNAVTERVGQNYHDQWGHDRPLLMERLREVFRVLLNPQFEASQVTVQREGNRGFWRAKIAFKASGEFAHYVQSRVNSLETPFELEWEQGATWPWDWKLVSTRNPELEIREALP